MKCCRESLRKLNINPPKSHPQITQIRSASYEEHCDHSNVLTNSFAFMVFVFTATAQTKPTKPRARHLGIPCFDGNPAALNAITDVAGVEVGSNSYFR